VLKEGDVEPDDVPSVTATHSGVDQTVRCKVKAARGPKTMPAELAGPESVPSGGGPSGFGSAGPLPTEVTLGGSGGHADPTAARMATELLELEEQTEVLSGSGVSSPGPVAAAAAAVAVGDPVESVVAAIETPQKARLSSEISLKLYLTREISHLYWTNEKCKIIKDKTLTIKDILLVVTRLDRMEGDTPSLCGKVVVKQ